MWSCNNVFWDSSTFHVYALFSTFILGALKRAQKVLRLAASNVPTNNEGPDVFFLNTYTWNRGPRRSNEDAIENQIARKWNLIILQEASDYVEHEILHERFHVTHLSGCAVFINKDTF